MLSRAGLRDDSRLLHAPREKRLPDGVVDLVRAGVTEIFALEPEVEAELLGEAIGVTERRRTADEILEQELELLHERAIPARLRPRALELFERGNQRLGHVAAAVRSEPSWNLNTHFDASSTACMNARMRAGSLMPGALSTPLATSTAYGLSFRTTSPTLSGSRPPATKTRA